MVDPQAARKDLRHEPHPAASGLARNPAPLRAGRGVPRSRARASHAEQPEDERLHEGDRGRVRHRQGADHPLRPPHLRLHGRRIRDADRRAGQDSRPLEHQHDAPLRQVLRDGHRPRDGGLRRAAGVGGFGRVAGMTAVCHGCTAIDEVVTEIIGKTKFDAYRE